MERFYGILSLVLATVLSVLIYFATGWPFFIIWIIILGLITFSLYGLDKNIARLETGSSIRRIPENTLHLLALLGGFAGGWIGMAVFHHKTRKPVFRVVLIISTILNLIVLYLLYVR